MASEIVMPKLGLTMKKGTITKWLKNEGDAVTSGEPLFEMETEKLTNTIEAGADGVVLKLIGEVGGEYEVGALLGYIGEAGESVNAPAAEEKAPAEAPAEAEPASGNAASEILMPKLGLTMKTGTLTKWLKKEGDAVSTGEPLFEMETEKLTNTIEAGADGILLKITAEEGGKFAVGDVLGYIGQPGDICGSSQAPAAASAEPAGSAPSAAPAAAAPSRPEGGRIFISPVARKLAEKRGIDISTIKGSGPNGRIVKADIENYVAPKAAPEPAAPAAAAPVLPAMDTEEGDTIIPYSGMRKAIGENMLRTWTTVPMVTHNVTLDASALMDFRKTLNANAAEKKDKVSVNDIIMKITATALERMPIINSSLSDKGIILHKHIHLGMAVAVDNGLLVPVVHDANRKGLLTVSRECKELAGKARSGGLGFEDMSGATFTVTNLGGYGSVDSFSPIINLPQAAILGVGRAVDTVVPAEGGFEVHPMMTFSLTYDHRIIDGAVAAEFMKIFMELFADPLRAVLD